MHEKVKHRWQTIGVTGALDTYLLLLWFGAIELSYQKILQTLAALVKIVSPAAGVPKV